MCSSQLPSTAHLSQDSAVSVVSRLRAGRLLIVTILLSEVRDFACRRHPDRQWTHTAYYSACVGEFLSLGAGRQGHLVILSVHQHLAPNYTFTYHFGKSIKPSTCILCSYSVFYHMFVFPFRFFSAQSCTITTTI